MADFETGAELSLTVTNRELSAVRSQIENELSDIPIGVDASVSGGSRQPRDPSTGRFMGIEGVEQRIIEQTELQVELLDDIKDAVGGGGGGVGLGGAALAGRVGAGGGFGLGLGAGGAAGALGMLGPLGAGLAGRELLNIADEEFDLIGEARSALGFDRGTPLADQVTIEDVIGTAVDLQPTHIIGEKLFLTASDIIQQETGGGDDTTVADVTPGDDTDTTGTGIFESPTSNAAVNSEVDALRDEVNDFLQGDGAPTTSRELERRSALADVNAATSGSRARTPSEIRAENRFDITLNLDQRIDAAEEVIREAENYADEKKDEVLRELDEWERRVNNALR